MQSSLSKRPIVITCARKHARALYPVRSHRPSQPRTLIVSPTSPPTQVAVADNARFCTTTNDNMTVPSKLRDFVVGILVFVQEVWCHLLAILTSACRYACKAFDGSALFVDSRQRLASQQAPKHLSALDGDARVSTTSEVRGANEAVDHDEDKATHAPQFKARLPASASSPSIWQPRTCINLPPRGAGAAAPMDPISVNDSTGRAGISAPLFARQRRASFDVAEQQHASLIGDVSPSIKQLRVRAQEVLSRVQHVLYDTPNAASELAGEMMGRSNYYHPRPTRSSLSTPPGSPRTVAARAATTANTPSRWGWSNRRDISLQSMLDAGGFWTSQSSPADVPSPAGPRQRRSDVRVSEKGQYEHAADAPGQAMYSVSAGPLGSEMLAEGLRTAGHTIRHPQVAAAELAGRMLGKSSGHDTCE